MLPDFLIVGAQRAGTTSMWATLRQHPELWVTDQKELNFFLVEGAWDRGLDWYRAQFDGAPPEAVTGEVSPGYTMFPTFRGVVERMADVVPDARLVYVLRDPVERMRSNYAQARADGTEWRDIETALIRDTRYVTVSQYATQIHELRRFYSPHQILLVTAEEWRTDGSAVIDRLATFLDATPGWWLDGDLSENESAHKLFHTRLGCAVHGAAVRWPRLRPVARRLRHLSAVRRPPRAGEADLSPELRATLARWLRTELDALADLTDVDIRRWWPRTCADAGLAHHID